MSNVFLSYKASFLHLQIVSKTEKNLSVSRTLPTFADHLSESLQSNVDLDETEMRSVFEQAITNIFGLNAKKRLC